MRLRMFLSTAVIWSALPAAAQTPGIPRTLEGRPDFQGMWHSRWRTPLERPADFESSVVEANKAEEFIAALNASRKVGNEDQHPDEDYDDGPLLPAANGGYRTSLIIMPESGKRPFTAEADAASKAFTERSKVAEGPEVFGLATRCLRAGGATPLLLVPDQMYRQIIQTPAHLVIATEAMGDTRVIEMNAATRPDVILTWTGDSAARWEGDTLIIETARLRPEPTSPAVEPGQKPRTVIERLSFRSPDEIDYTYTVDDPAMFTEPMTVNFSLVRSPERMFESACHEGNYALANIMRGARVIEARAATKPKP